MTITNTRRDQMARDLVRCLREEFRGDNGPLDQFRREYLPSPGWRIARTASESMSDSELLALAYRALAAPQR